MSAIVIRLCFKGFALFALLGAGAAQSADFLDPAEAFRAAPVPAYAKHQAAVEFQIAEGYHLYRDRTEIRPLEGSALAGKVSLPPGLPKYDANFGATMALWKQSLRLDLPIPASQAHGRYEIQVQGCAEQGLCYPPQTLRFLQDRDAQGRAVLALEAPAPGAAEQPSGQEASGASPSAVEPAPGGARTPQPGRDEERPSQGADPEDLGVVLKALRSGHWPAVAGLFLLLGLGLAFTPCVLPMMPILSSIIVGQHQPVSRWRGLGLAAAYSLGMALVYTAMGVAAGLAGAGLAAALQNPWVLGSFALLLGVLALSMFGVWEFQMPAFVQSRAQEAANRLPGGRHAGVFAMGGLSALMVGPCVAAPLAGALVYIGQSGDAALGALALFSLATGMSVPLLLLGASAGALLPRAGAWMERVKMAFGVLLLAVALWLVTPVLPGPALPGLLGALLLLGAAQLWAASAWRRGFSLLLGLWAVSLLVGAWSGGRSIALPLQHLARAGGPAAAAGAAASAAAGTGADNTFRRVADLAALEQALAEARRESRPVLLDFYADWCVACKEMEHQTFQDAQVQPLMQQLVRLQADVTANSSADQALLRRFGLFGPPGVLLFNALGQEQGAIRSIGFVEPQEFARRLRLAQR